MEALLVLMSDWQMPKGDFEILDEVQLAYDQVQACVLNSRTDIDLWGKWGASPPATVLAIRNHAWQKARVAWINIQSKLTLAKARAEEAGTTST